MMKITRDARNTVDHGATSRATRMGNVAALSNHLQPSLPTFGEAVSAPSDGTIPPAYWTMLHDALRRHGVEGENAFLVLAARYAEDRGLAGRDFRFFPLDSARAVLGDVTNDRRLLSVLDDIIRSDPEGRELPTWYQFFFGRRFREGSGKFFTPRAIASAMAGLLPVLPGATVMDPTCGGGTFLLETSRRWQGTGCRLLGNDVDRMLVGLTELLLALSASEEHEISLSCGNLYDAGPALENWRGKVNHILANPPFSLPLERVGRPGELFAMGYRNSDALFLDVCLELLAPGGRLVCLLPHSLVVNGEFESLRRTVEKRWEMCGVVTLPEGIFYLTGNTTTRADIVCLRKRDGRKRPAQTAFFANAPAAGVALNSRSTHLGENSLDLIVSDPRVLNGLSDIC